MIRTTDTAVKAIIEVDPRIDLTPFIETGSAVVDNLHAADSKTLLDDVRLELIERWLSAHFYAIRDARRTGDTAGDVSATYESKVDFGLKLTRYGQQALILDTTGYLNSLNSAKLINASVTWLGSTCSPYPPTCIP